MTFGSRAVVLTATLALAGCSDAADNGAPGPTATSTTADSRDLDAEIREIAADWYGPSAVGGVVAVVGTSDGAVHVAALGEAAPSRPAEREDVMRIGSITKTFTAAVILRLASQGLVDLDDPVAEHLPELGLASEITIRRLLSHTSGITDPDVAGLIKAFAADPARRYRSDELVSLAHLPTTGERREFAYANANYHLAGMLVEQVTGRDFASVLRSEIFDVAGLEHTYLVGFEPVPEPVVPGNVDLDGDGTEDPLARVPYLAVDTYAWSAGAIATTATDLVTFARALFDGTLLDDVGIAELTDRDGGGDRPLGIVRVDQDAWGHNGGAPGYQAVYVYQRDRGTVAALFTNCPSCAVGTPDTWPVVADLLATAEG